jgi:hypothetical protein
MQQLNNYQSIKRIHAVVAIGAATEIKYFPEVRLLPNWYAHYSGA